MMMFVRGIPTILNNDSKIQFSGGYLFPTKGSFTTPTPTSSCTGASQKCFTWVG